MKDSTSPAGCKVGVSTSKSESLDSRWFDVFQPGTLLKALSVVEGNPEPLNLGIYEVHGTVASKRLEGRALSRPVVSATTKGGRPFPPERVEKKFTMAKGRTVAVKREKECDSWSNR